MHNLEDLNDLRLVSLIAETGSLSGAARRLGVNHATVFRRLGQFEDRIGVRLFERNTGRYVATAAGEELAKTGTAMNDQATQALLRVAGGDLRPSGMVSLTTTDSVALGLLNPILVKCRAQYPQIRVSIDVDNRDLNLSQRDADIAVRPTLKPPEHLIGKFIAPLPFCVYGSKDYLETTGSRTLADHQWIALDASYTGHRTLRWLEKIKPLDTVGIRTNTLGCVRRACEEGLGLALLPCFLGDQSANLQRLGEPEPDCASALWLLTHPDLRETVRIKVVFQLLHTWLASAMQRLSDAP